ncbi:hypothetical protein [Parabacteroides timonensis]|uniref:hypothetical protein n=1 Tax=Parabacteroides timonensis TaxID=1871013 RepID=UPI00094F27A4|nr:hypothetical protein [Parabacteroides timonensis]
MTESAENGSSVKSVQAHLPNRAPVLPRNVGGVRKKKKETLPGERSGGFNKLNKLLLWQT